MSLNVPYRFRAFISSDAGKLNENFSRVYAVKLESRWHYDASSTAGVSYLYQGMELGEANFSANGSGTIVKSFPLVDIYGKILFATAHAKNSAAIAYVSDVTGTSITIEVRTVSGTAGFSSVITASVPVYWQVIGATKNTG